MLGNKQGSDAHQLQQTLRINLLPSETQGWDYTLPCPACLREHSHLQDPDGAQGTAVGLGHLTCLSRVGHAKPGHLGLYLPCVLCPSFSDNS